MKINERGHGFCDLSAFPVSGDGIYMPVFNPWRLRTHQFEGRFGISLITSRLEDRKGLW